MTASGAAIFFEPRRPAADANNKKAGLALGLDH